MPKETFYITTAIHYVNDLPHIGHIYENVVADTVARYRRLRGDDVFFLTGTDEHGQKIQRSAAKQGVLPIELADRVVENHLELWKKLNITNDDFIRTTENRHRVSVYELIRRIQERNPEDIYLGEHTGWYCQNEETYVPESQVEDGRDAEGHPVERTTEKNFFFKLSKYERLLLELYRDNPSFIYPKTRYNEVVSFVEQGLKDLSVSRTSIDWGIPFPGHPDHVIYVWMDALTNYITALGFGAADQDRFDQYWPADAHLIGKDIVRFHAVYWPAFLMAAGVELPKQIVTHGWWLRDDQKISKSTGNIVRPGYVIDEFGPDPLRYYMLREMVFGHDANYSDEAFISRYNSDLANDLGNTLSRALKMTDSYFQGKTPPIPCRGNQIRDAADRLVPLYLQEMDKWAFQKALDVVWDLLNEINAYIVNREPWKHFKEKGADDALSRILWDTLEGLRIVWTMMSPLMPAVSAEALRRIGAGDVTLDEKALRWGGLPTRKPVAVSEALFPRVDSKEWLDRLVNEQKEKEVNENEKMGETGPPIETTQAINEDVQPEGTKPAEPPSDSSSGPPRETTEAQPPDAQQISIDQFFETDLRVAEIIAAEKIEKSNKLLKLRVSTGDSERTVVAGIAKQYEPDEIVGRKIVIVANLEPARLMGVESQGMVLAADRGGKPTLLSVDPAVPAGTRVR
ncbi:MAG: methionine--tRNA ligase [Acidobacteria bacterium]|nr:methionine--tRNA ligase [Acidobacteriota bacterium]